MRRLSLWGVLSVSLVAFGAASCNSDSTTTPTTPTTPTPVTEAFSGSLNVNGAITFPFTASQAGSANAVIKSLQPDANVAIDGGTGNFSTGETVYQGASLAEAVWTGVVYAWTPAQNVLSVRSMTGTFAPNTTVVGVDSQVQRSGSAITTSVIGIALGTWSGTTCSIVLANDLSGVGSTVTGVVQSAGSLCARVYDVGKLPSTATFTIEVTHY